jgi:hypothetical protein
MARAVEEVGFLQYINIHESDKAIDLLLRSPRVAAAAAALLGVNRVRLYQVGLGREPVPFYM